jgi:hypothetical protein
MLDCEPLQPGAVVPSHLSHCAACCGTALLQAGGTVNRRSIRSRGRGGGRCAEGCPNLFRVGGIERWDGQCGDQGSSQRILDEAELC